MGQMALASSLSRIVERSGMQLIRGYVQAPVGVAMATKGSVDTMDVKVGKAQVGKHGGHRFVSSISGALVSVSSNRRVISGKLLYQNLKQRLTMCFAIYDRGAFLVEDGLLLAPSSSVLASRAPVIDAAQMKARSATSDLIRCPYEQCS